MHIIYKVVFTISISLLVAAFVIAFIYPLRLGVDFTGGSVIELSFPGSRPVLEDLNQTVRGVSGVTDASSSPAGDNDVFLRLNSLDEATHQQVLKSLTDKFGPITENRFDSVGPSVGAELRQKSVYAIVLLLLAIVVYIAVVFRKVARVLSPWAMGVAALLALLHDVIIPVGVFALLGHFYGIEISAVFVAAALTILGYSVSDTVVVFDRVRENVLRFGSKEKFSDLVHRSVMQTLTRSLNTNLTVLLSLIAIYFFGGESIKYFSLALIIGIFLGAYSSIFVASPVLVWWHEKSKKKKS